LHSVSYFDPEFPLRCTRRHQNFVRSVILMNFHLKNDSLHEISLEKSTNLLVTDVLGIRPLHKSLARLGYWMFVFLLLDKGDPRSGCTELEGYSALKQIGNLEFCRYMTIPQPSDKRFTCAEAGNLSSTWVPREWIIRSCDAKSFKAINCAYLYWKEEVDSSFNRLCTRMCSSVIPTDNNIW
jgi:hypothetical protein